MDESNQVLNVPSKLPFLDAICWQASDLKRFSLDEILSLYERNISYNGVLAELEGDELIFVRELAKLKGSWLQSNV